MLQKIISYVVVGVITLILNIIIDLFLFRDKETSIKKYITSFWKEKKYIIIYLISIIMEIAIFSYMGIDNLFFLYFFVLLFMIRISYIDFRTKYVDNKLLMLLGITAIFSLALFDKVTLSNSLITGGVSFVIFFLLSKVTSGAMGIGDAFVIGILGLICGYRGLINILVFSGASVFLCSLFLIIKSRENKNKELPFTPFITLGLFIALIINNF